MFHYGLVVAFMIPKTQKSPVLCVIDRAFTGIKHFSYITQNIMKMYINKQFKGTFGLKYMLITETYMLRLIPTKRYK